MAKEPESTILPFVTFVALTVTLKVPLLVPAPSNCSSVVPSNTFISFPESGITPPDKTTLPAESHCTNTAELFIFILIGLTPSATARPT